MLGAAIGRALVRPRLPLDDAPPVPSPATNCERTANENHAIGRCDCFRAAVEMHVYADDDIVATCVLCHLPVELARGAA